MKVEKNFHFNSVFILFAVMCVLSTKATEKFVSDSIIEKDTFFMQAFHEVFGKEHVSGGVQELVLEILNEMKGLGNEVKTMGNAMKKQETTINELTQDVNMLNKKVGELEYKLEKVTNKSVEERLDHLEEIEKISALRSCHELQEYGIKTSGVYTIDPDGPRSGYAPFAVVCNFEQGFTEVRHNYEYPVEIEHCNTPRCFEMVLDYSVPAAQLETLIDISEACTQSLSYTCFLAPLSVNENAVGVWVNRQGEEEEYWTGSNSGVHVCECGLSNNCTQNELGFRCNCDAPVPILQEDNGKLDNMTALPVKSFRYGELEYETEFGTIEIGRLKCEGQKEVKSEELYDSCRNLKVYGESASGNYVMNSGKVSFCNLEKQLDDPDIEQEIPWMRFNSVM